MHTKTTASHATFDKQGHRGCRGLMPENTIPAMLRAVDLGVNTLELDLVITADSQVLVSHDPFFNHVITTKSNGEYVTEAEERKLNIFKMTYAETQTYDVGLRPHEKFPKQQKLAVHKPLLSDLIDSVERYLKSKNLPPVAYNIETKTTAATDGIFHPAPEVFVRLMMQVINQKGIQDKVIIQSFDLRTLKIIHDQYPGMQTALLIDEGDKVGVAENIKRLGFTPTIYSPHYSLVNEAVVKYCHGSGIKIIPWTVNSKKEILQLKNMGVDGLISDYPDLYNQVLH